MDKALGEINRQFQRILDESPTLQISQAGPSPSHGGAGGGDSCPLQVVQISLNAGAMERACGFFITYLKRKATEGAHSYNRGSHQTGTSQMFVAQLFAAGLHTARAWRSRRVMKLQAFDAFIETRTRCELQLLPELIFTKIDSFMSLGSSTQWWAAPSDACAIGLGRRDPYSPQSGAQEFIQGQRGATAR